jgi:hypothetical protein
MYILRAGASPVGTNQHGGKLRRSHILLSCLEIKVCRFRTAIAPPLNNGVGVQLTMNLKETCHQLKFLGDSSCPQRNRQISPLNVSRHTATSSATHLLPLAPYAGRAGRAAAAVGSIPAAMASFRRPTPVLRRPFPASGGHNIFMMHDAGL